jgi:hypothetical protein
MLALALPSVLPSVLVDGVGTPDSFISQLDTLPACAPVTASRLALRLAAHDSGSGWLATPFLYGSFIHNSTPVYPGAPTIHFVPCPAWFFRLRRPFFAGAKLPCKNASLHFNSWRSFNSLRNVRQIFNQTPRSAESQESLPAHHDSRSTDDHLCVVWAAWGARARFSFTALRSATDRIAPSALLRRC